MRQLSLVGDRIRLIRVGKEKERLLAMRQRPSNIRGDYGRNIRSQLAGAGGPPSSSHVQLRLIAATRAELKVAVTEFNQLFGNRLAGLQMPNAAGRQGDWIAYGNLEPGEITDEAADTANAKSD